MPTRPAAAPRSAPDDAAVRAVRVAALHVYPVKALAGIALRESPVDDLGLAGDRRWMLVDAAGRALTQREVPSLVRLATALLPDGGVRVTAPDGSTRDLHPAARSAPRRRVRLFDDLVEAATYDRNTDAWLTARTGVPCALVHLPDDVIRPVDPDYAEAEDRAAFADGFPILVASEASLGDLNARLAARGAPAVPMARFRPNVVLAGDDMAPYAEDAWRTLRIGEGDDAVTLRLVKPCARCVVTTVDPSNGATGREPLRTLAEYRRRDGKVMFAQNALVRGAGTVRVGDAVHATPS
jgi:uncharacterized protein YcbX